MRAVTVLASPWSALHRTPDRIRAATFGTFDGATSSYGVTFAMFAQRRGTALRGIRAPCGCRWAALASRRAEPAPAHIHYNE